MGPVSHLQLGRPSASSSSWWGPRGPPHTRSHFPKNNSSYFGLIGWFTSAAGAASVTGASAWTAAGSSTAAGALSAAGA